MLGVIALAWAGYVVWSVQRALTQTTFGGGIPSAPDPDYASGSGFGSDFSAEAQELSQPLLEARVPLSEDAGNETCDLLVAGVINRNLPTTVIARSHIVPDSLPSDFSYNSASDQSLRQRAFAGDGFAQYMYGERQLESVVREAATLSPDELRQGDWEQRFAMMIGFHVMAFRNGSNLAPGRLGEAYLFNTPNRDPAEAAAWLNISQMVGGYGTEHFENAGVLSLTDRERKTGQLLSNEYIDLYGLGDIPGVMKKDFLVEELLDSQMTDGAELLPGNLAPDNCVPDLTARGFVVDAETIDLVSSSDEGDPFAIAMSELDEFQSETEQHRLFPGSVSDTDLDLRFRSVRRELINALKRGDERALPALIEIHSAIDAREDTLEAGAWKEIGARLFGIEPDQALEEPNDNSGDPDLSVSLRAEQYIVMFGFTPR